MSFHFSLSSSQPYIFSRFPSFLHSVPMCTLTALESKDCLALLLCNSIAYLRLPEIILSNALFLDLFPAGILYCFIIMDHRYYYHKIRPRSPGESGYPDDKNKVTACTSGTETGRHKPQILLYSG